MCVNLDPRKKDNITHLRKHAENHENNGQTGSVIRKAPASALVVGIKPPPNGG